MLSLRVAGIFRAAGAAPGLVGLNIASGQEGCLDGPDAGHGASAVRVDGLASWVTGVMTDIGANFRTYHNSLSRLVGNRAGRP